MKRHPPRARQLLKLLGITPVAGYNSIARGWDSPLVSLEPFGTLISTKHSRPVGFQNLQSGGVWVAQWLKKK